MKDSEQNRRQRRRLLTIVTLVTSLLLIFPGPLTPPLLGQHTTSALSGQLLESRNFPTNSYLQAGSSGSLELGYGPGSLNPISQGIPVYTVNDQLWVESNYNASISVELEDQTGGNLTGNVSINHGTVMNFYQFGSTLSTSNLTLLISGSQSFNVPLQFVNPFNDSIGNGAPAFSLRSDALFGALASLNLSDKFDIQECLTNASSSSEAQVSLPTPFGSGFVSISEDPVTSEAELFTQKAVSLSPFTFSYELLGNFTYALPSGRGYASSEIVVSRSDSVYVPGASSTAINLSVSNLASLRTGRYILRAIFENAIASQISETTLFFKSPVASWFWLGSCGKLNNVGPPTISLEENLTGPTGLWPKFLYLMYQVEPGVEGFANISLNLNLNRVLFVVSPSRMTLPSDIQVSADPSISSNRAIQSVDIGREGVVYLITNGTYPVSAAFDLLFGGKVFAAENVILNSSYGDVFQNISLGELVISATRGGQGLFNATVTILANNLSASVVEYTNSNGIVDLYVPPGNYTIAVKSGGQTLTSSQIVFSQGQTQYAAIFSSPANYTQDLIWVLYVITFLGAVANFWFWFGRRRVRKFLGERD